MRIGYLCCSKAFVESGKSRIVRAFKVECDVRMSMLLYEIVNYKRHSARLFGSIVGSRKIKDSFSIAENEKCTCTKTVGFVVSANNRSGIFINHYIN